jgi:glyoxalase superfamily protein
MSQQLPARPNLEHLRKQAKDLAHEVQARDPAFTLSDAQHEIAKTYGFASWPKLKAHVEQAPSTAAGHPFDGTWVADVSKSMRHPANQFRSATMAIAVSGDVVTIDDVVINESGGEDRGRNTIVVDGTERVFDYGYAMTARWQGANVIETLATQNGAVVGRGRYEVSDDRKTLIVTGEGQRIVLDRKQVRRVR